MSFKSVILRKMSQKSTKPQTKPTPPKFPSILKNLQPIHLNPTPNPTPIPPTLPQDPSHPDPIHNNPINSNKNSINSPFQTHHPYHTILNQTPFIPRASDLQALPNPKLSPNNPKTLSIRQSLITLQPTSPPISLSFCIFK